MIQDSDLDTTTASRLSERDRWLLWLSGGVAAALALVAFVLWGTRGAAYLLDHNVVLCL